MIRRSYRLYLINNVLLPATCAVMLLVSQEDASAWGPLLSYSGIVCVLNLHHDDLPITTLKLCNSFVITSTNPIH